MDKKVLMSFNLKAFNISVAIYQIPSQTIWLTL